MRVAVREKARKRQASSIFASKKIAPSLIVHGETSPSCCNSLAQVFSKPRWQITRKRCGVADTCRLMRLDKDTVKVNYFRRIFFADFWKAQKEFPKFFRREKVSNRKKRKKKIEKDLHFKNVLEALMKKILLLVILACAMVSAEPYVHDGFYMSFQYIFSLLI